MRCSDCRPRRGCGGGCGDFSSRAARRPNLLEIEVVTQIFHAAMRNLVARDVDCARGLLSAEDIDAADDKLVHWVAQTFGGRNKHFEASDEWHPEGLARHILHVLASPMSGSMPVDDEEVLERAARLFIRDVRAMAGRLAGPLPRAIRWPNSQSAGRTFLSARLPAITSAECFQQIALTDVRGLKAR